MGSGAREKLRKKPIKKADYLDDRRQLEPEWAEQFAQWVETELDRLREARQNEDPEPPASDEELDENDQDKGSQ